MADEAAEVQEITAKKQSTNLKLMIMGAVIVVLTAAVSFGVAMYTASSMSHKEEAKGDGFGVVKSDTLGTTFDAGEYITNLNSEAGDRFIKVKVVVAFEDAKVQEEINNKLPEIQHVINSTLRQQTPQSLTEPHSMEKLANLLKKNINALLIKGNLSNLYFTSFVIQ